MGLVWAICDKVSAINIRDTKKKGGEEIRYGSWPNITTLTVLRGQYRDHE